MSIIPSEDDPLLSPATVAQIFGVKPYTVTEWINQGKLKGVKVNRLWRIQRSEMIRYANERYGSD